MMSGSHMPPAGPHHQGRRQGEHHHQHQPHQLQHQQPHYHYALPPQAQSPVHINPYAQYHHPHHYAPPHASPYSQPIPQWYPATPYHQPHQYAMPPRPFQPHGSPVVVSSHPHMMPMTPVSRSLGQTPPIVHSRTPPVMRNQTPQPVPSTPSITSQTQVSSPTPPTDMTTPTPPPILPPRSSRDATHSPQQDPTHRMPKYPQLPWLSVPGSFPPRAQRRRRRNAPATQTDQALTFPSREQTVASAQTQSKMEEAVKEAEQTPTEKTEVSPASTIAAPSDVETPSTSHTPSEVGAESAQHIASPPAAPAPPARPVASHARTATIPVVPLIPIKPVKAPSVTSTTPKSAKSATEKEPAQKLEQPLAPTGEEGSAEVTPKASPPPKAPPASWAALLRSKAPPPSVQPPTVPNGAVTTNGTTPKSNTLADVLASFSVESEKKISFLKPRGLVNSGNLCYMNSILQVLLFCVPFYDFLDQVAKRAAHSFNSETPLVDAMIMFMRDFKVIDSASSAEQLQFRLKDNELEQYGDPLAPEYVYDVIKRLPRFDNMKRGQQEDAEEFLGFLLAGLHDECANVIKTGRRASLPSEALISPHSDRSASVDGGWEEVGPKQRPATMQSSGAIEVETPLTKIFGGKLRSEYRKPGEKLSITHEPYQPLQLDISSPHINSITDALKAMTQKETLDSATQGARASTKQVFIETVPPVLILHLKRFHYDTNGPQKIWKKVGYPLELEIPKQAFTQQRAAQFGLRGLPRYRLAAVVYHHGKNASGGHYTVDLRRQDGREWIRMDDTILRRIRAEDVAEGGAEEDPKVLAAALEQHKKDAGNSRNFYELPGEEEKKDEGGWSQVNGSAKEGKKWSNVANGTATPSSAGKRTPLPKENVRDNKVAYILFYQRIET